MCNVVKCLVTICYDGSTLDKAHCFLRRHILTAYFMKTDQDILTSAQAAKLKKVSRTAIYNALSDGRLQGVRVLGHIGIARDVLKAWQPHSRVGRPAGKPMSQDAKQKMAEAQKRRWAARKSQEP